MPLAAVGLPGSARRCTLLLERLSGRGGQNVRTTLNYQPPIPNSARGVRWRGWELAVLSFRLKAEATGTRTVNCFFLLGLGKLQSVVDAAVLRRRQDFRRTRRQILLLEQRDAEQPAEHPEDQTDQHREHQA